MIEINALSYAYPRRDRPVLRDITLRVDDGEFVLLTGPSGSGKSTLLRCLNGLVPHFSGGVLQGQVRVAGLDVVSAGPQQMSRHVGFVFQNPEAQAVLDRVEPEIAFGLENGAAMDRLREKGGADEARIGREMRDRVAEVMELLGLTQLRHRSHHTLSGGERQKVALAGALVLRPSLLVLDEPTSQLDPRAAAELLETLVTLNQTRGYTIVLAEHRLERVLPFASRVVHLEEGRIFLDAPPRDAAERLPQVPPVVELGRRLGWMPLPLAVDEARAKASSLIVDSRDTGQPAETRAEPSSDVLLAVDDLTFAYQQEPVLRSVSLSVKAGEVVALVGHNGSGKSTLLRCIVGLLQPGKGAVRISGRETHRRSVADICRQVAYLPQNPDDLLFADTVAQELYITLRNHSLSDDREAVAQMLEQLGLGDVQNAYPRDLSVGQRQRVALGSVAITEPDLVLLDEPTRGLDPAAKETLIGIWRRWLARGRGILLVTHDVELVAQIASRVVILEKGMVVAAGAAATILPRHPTFAPQISRLFPHQQWLTVEECLGGGWVKNPPAPTHRRAGFGLSQ